MGDKLPKHIYHSIVCIGALIVQQEDGYWKVGALGAPHVGDRPENELITAFVTACLPRSLALRVNLSALAIRAALTRL